MKTRIVAMIVATIPWVIKTHWELFLAERRLLADGRRGWTNPELERRVSILRKSLQK